MLKPGLRLDQQLARGDGVTHAVPERRGGGLVLGFDPRRQIGERIVARLGDRRRVIHRAPPGGIRGALACAIVSARKRIESSAKNHHSP
jgi:hypothetical protein